MMMMMIAINKRTLLSMDGVEVIPPLDMTCMYLPTGYTESNIKVKFFPAVVVT